MKEQNKNKKDKIKLVFDLLNWYDDTNKEKVR